MVVEVRWGDGQSDGWGAWADAAQRTGILTRRFRKDLSAQQANAQRLANAAPRCALDDVGKVRAPRSPTGRSEGMQRMDHVRSIPLESSIARPINR